MRWLVAARFVAVAAALLAGAAPALGQFLVFQFLEQVGVSWPDDNVVRGEDDTLPEPVSHSYTILDPPGNLHYHAYFEGEAVTKLIQKAEGAAPEGRVRAHGSTYGGVWGTGEIELCYGSGTSHCWPQVSSGVHIQYDFIVQAKNPVNPPPIQDVPLILLGFLEVVMEGGEGPYLARAQADLRLKWGPNEQDQMIWEVLGCEDTVELYEICVNTEPPQRLILFQFLYHYDPGWEESSVFRINMRAGAGVQPFVYWNGETATATARAMVDPVVYVDPSFEFADDFEVVFSFSDNAPVPVDFGDAPDPTYPTLITSNGARHEIGEELYLGACVDHEWVGQPTSNARGDNQAEGEPVYGTCEYAGQDEDGVRFYYAPLNPLLPERQLGVTASAAGLLDAWIDLNLDGDWADPGEQIFTGQALSAGINELWYSVPPDTAPGSTFARFRVSSAGGLSYDGPAPDGEVEDYSDSFYPGNNLDAFNANLSEDMTFYACNSITAGGDFTTFPDLSILAPAKVVFHAGNEVILRNGVFIEEGAELSVVLGGVPLCGGE